MKRFIFILVSGIISITLQAQINNKEQRPYTEGEKITISIVYRQLEAYNNRDIEAFLETFADDIKVYAFPNILGYEGKEQLRLSYTKLFEDNEHLHCKIISEVVAGNIIIHEESVIFNDPDNPNLFICIYVIKDGKISELYFI